MIKMAALGGLLLMIVVVATIVYLAGLAWLARHDVREDESPPQETSAQTYPISAIGSARRHRRGNCGTNTTRWYLNFSHLAEGRIANFSRADRRPANPSTGPRSASYRSWSESTHGSRSNQ